MERNEKAEKKQCMGCQTSFEQLQKVAKDENLTIEYKNYSIPFKDDKAKWTILKTIVSFLNSKGGTIFIGIQDEHGSVQGVFLTRKERDNFRLSMKHLMDKIYPKLDLNNTQQVTIQFIPIFKNQEFRGKYIVKIIVQQGDPSQVYSFGEKIKLESPNNKVDEFEIFYAYERHNQGGTDEFKGAKLLSLVHSKAKNPYKIASTFHQGCNPQPPHLQLQIRRIHFSNTTLQHLKLLQNGFKDNFQQLDIQYETQYLKDQKTICLIINDEQQFTSVKQFIVGNIEYLNNNVFGDVDVHFEVRGEVQYYCLIENMTGKAGSQAKRADRKKEEKQVRKVEKEKEKDKQVKKQFINIMYKRQQKVRQIPIPKKIQNITNFPKKYSITFTHIQPSAINQLQAFLTNSIHRNYQKQFAHYINTIQVFLKNQQQFQRYASTVMERQKQLKGFGFKQEIRWGINQGVLRICNYDKDRKDQLRMYLQNTMRDQKRSIEQKKQNGRFSMSCLMKDKSTACQWLDILLKDRDIKKFSIPNNHRANNIAKLKIYLGVVL